MRAAAVEAVPAVAYRSLRETRAIACAIVVENVVLAGDVENLFRANLFERLLRSVELYGLGKLRYVAGVQHKCRRRRQRVNFGDGLAQRAHNIGIRGLVEANVTVADLHES